MNTIMCCYQESVMMKSCLFLVYNTLSRPAEIIFALTSDAIAADVSSSNKKKIKN
jgi:hypothetical protein